jgi:hypothetical protein
MGPIEVLLSADQETYRAGDLVSFVVKASADCNLTLINVDGGGKATVLFPNDFQRDNRVAAGTPLSIPGPGAPYSLRVKERGNERFIAICTRKATRPKGIAHQFGHQRFTFLGDWPTFVRTADEKEAEILKKSDRRSRRSRREAGGEPVSPVGAEPEGRAVLIIHIE